MNHRTDAEHQKQQKHTRDRADQRSDNCRCRKSCKQRVFSSSSAIHVFQCIDIIRNRHFPDLFDLIYPCQHLNPFFFMGLKICNQPFSFIQHVSIHLRLAQYLVKYIFAAGRKCIVDTYKNFIHLQIVPGDIIDHKLLSLIPFRIMGAAFQFLLGIFPIRYGSPPLFQMPQKPFALPDLIPDDHGSAQDQDAPCREQGYHPFTFHLFDILFDEPFHAFAVAGSERFPLLTPVSGIPHVPAYSGSNVQTPLCQKFLRLHNFPHPDR